MFQLGLQLGVVHVSCGGYRDYLFFAFFYSLRYRDYFFCIFYILITN